MPVLQRSCSGRCALALSPSRGANRRGMDPALVAVKGSTPTMANTVEERFIGRLVRRVRTASTARSRLARASRRNCRTAAFSERHPASVSPTTSADEARRSFAVALPSSTIARRATMVFDMITNAPGVLSVHAAVGPAAESELPLPVIRMRCCRSIQRRTNSSRRAPDHGTSACSASCGGTSSRDIAYVGSKSDDLLRQVQINALPFGATLAPQNQDPTRAPAATLGSSALPTDLLRPYPGYGNIRMWDYSGYGNYHALQTSITRRFDQGWSFSGFYVWSKALAINSTDAFSRRAEPERRRRREGSTTR